MQLTDNDILQAIDDNNFNKPGVLNNGKVKFNFINSKVRAKKFIVKLIDSNFVKSINVEFTGSQIWVTVDREDLYLYLEC